MFQFDFISIDHNLSLRMIESNCPITITYFFIYGRLFFLAILRFTVVCIRLNNCRIIYSSNVPNFEKFGLLFLNFVIKQGCC